MNQPILTKNTSNQKLLLTSETAHCCVRNRPHGNLPAFLVAVVHDSSGTKIGCSNIIYRVDKTAGSVAHPIVNFRRHRTIAVFIKICCAPAAETLVVTTWSSCNNNIQVQKRRNLQK